MFLSVIQILSDHRPWKPESMVIREQMMENWLD